MASHFAYDRKGSSVCRYWITSPVIFLSCGYFIAFVWPIHSPIRIKKEYDRKYILYVRRWRKGAQGTKEKHKKRESKRKAAQLYFDWKFRLLYFLL